MEKPNYASDALANQYADISAIEFGNSISEIESTLHTMEMMRTFLQEEELERICKEKLKQGKAKLKSLGKEYKGIV